MKQYHLRTIYLFISVCVLQQIQAITLKITPEQARDIGKKIWHNECNGSIAGLTSWNRGEEFASLGIGHFIWHPAKGNTMFRESFPELVQFMQDQGARLPHWLTPKTQCPWKTREQFITAQNSARTKELRSLLSATIDLQTRFMFERLAQTIPSLTKNLSWFKARHVTKQFNRLAQSPNGIYALVDYLNFKGSGQTDTETYDGHGWGLRHVLEQMSGSGSSPEALHAFAQAAKKVLALRVSHSPPERNETRWLKGWYKRIDTYIA